MPRKSQFCTRPSHKRHTTEPFTRTRRSTKISATLGTVSQGEWLKGSGPTGTSNEPDPLLNASHAIRGALPPGRTYHLRRQDSSEENGFFDASPVKGLKRQTMLSNATSTRRILLVKVALDSMVCLFK